MEKKKKQKQKQRKQKTKWQQQKFQPTHQPTINQTTRKKNSSPQKTDIIFLKSNKQLDFSCFSPHFGRSYKHLLIHFSMK